MRSLFFSASSFAALAALTACGGKVFIDLPPGDGGSGGGGAGGASSSSTSSSSSSSSSSSGIGGSPGCPIPFPGIEAPCVGFEGSVCPVPNACCGGSAFCKEGLWTYDGPLCNEACTPTCGPNDFACVLGTVCAVYLAWTTVYSCEPDPCGDTLSCSCAAAICEQQGFVCNNTSDFQVYCDCPNC